MRKTTTKTKNQQVETSQFHWKRRPSEIRGYQRTLYITAENGDYIRIDYNLREKRIRLYVEVQNEGGSPYYSVIKNGKITAERSVLSGRTYGFSEKFSERAEIFSSIPNNDIIRLINYNYGISFAKKKFSGKGAVDKQRRLEETRKRYFVEDKNPYDEQYAGAERYVPKIGVIDILDIIVGLAISAGIFYYLQFDFIAMGVIAAFFGVSIGMVDMFIRERSPMIFKVIFFVVTGIASYIYGYYIS